MLQSLPDAVFFDWDGTLVDSLGFVFSAHNYVRGHFGLEPWSHDEFVIHVKYSSRVVYKDVYGDRAEDALEVLRQYSEDHYMQNVTVLDGSIEFLQLLARHGIPMGVVSNLRHSVLNKQVEYFKMRDFFKVVIGAGYAERDKPHADPLLKALDESGIQSGRHVLYVGDTETDLECAANAGCSVAFLYHGNAENPLITKHNPDFAAKNCHDLGVILFPEQVRS